MKHAARWSLVFLLLGFLLVFSGCASTESDNASVRPWNAPKTWETGVPGMMTEGR